MRSNWLIISPAAWLLATAIIVAQSPRPAELMPATTVFFAEGIPSDAVMQLPFVRNVTQSTLFRQLWNSPDAMKLRGGITLAEAALGERLPETLAKLTGKGWALGVDSHTNGIVLWAHARDTATCQELYKKLLSIAEADAKSKGRELKRATYRDAEAYDVNGSLVSRIDEYLIVSNKGELIKGLVDCWRDAPAKTQTLAGNPRFQNFQAAALETNATGEAGKSTRPLARAWLDVQQLHEAGMAKKLFEGPHDNFPAELLLGGVLATLRGAPALEARLNSEANQLHLQFASPIVKSTVADRYDYFFGQAGSGEAPARIELGVSQANVCLYRDIARLWQHAGDLFGQKTNDQLAQAETTLTTLFSGRDFANDILGAIRPELQLVVTEQTFGQREAPIPQVKLPAFALVTRLRDPQGMQPQMKRIFMSLIGFLNITSAMNHQPQLDLEAFRLESGWEVTATFAVDADRPKSWVVPIQYNFSPTLFMVGDHAILASTRALATAVSEQLKATPTKPVAVSDAHVNSLVQIDGDLLNKVLAANRQQLISQNMIEKGHSQEEAAKEIDLLLQAIQLIKSLQVSFSVSQQAMLDVRLDTVGTNKE